MRRRRGRATTVMVALGLTAMLGAACGDDGDGGERAEPGAPAIPASLGAAESAAEDSIDLILAGKRDRTVRSAITLEDLARGDLADDLEGVATAEEIAELQSRAQELARIAPDGEPLAVALAANRAFELIAGLFGRFETEVPGEVMLLDYHDFEAKLQALAHDLTQVRATVDRLAETWSGLHESVPSGNGGAAAGKRFDAHVAAMDALVEAGTDFDAMVKEAQHGLDLVDELEDAYAG